MASWMLSPGLTVNSAACALSGTRTNKKNTSNFIEDFKPQHSSWSGMRGSFKKDATLLAMKKLKTAEHY
ncbi:hypothetical protein ASZ90_009405 [hydrocarbon metagenome]|uniref:Uncharacterized protein n=1 Tax=hydrocarbon metagenome TaxID=938273 RepID=A0A0W8FJG5_9ZZZZ